MSFSHVGWFRDATAMFACSCYSGALPSVKVDQGLIPNHHFPASGRARTHPGRGRVTDSHVFFFCRDLSLLTVESNLHLGWGEGREVGLGSQGAMWVAEGQSGGRVPFGISMGEGEVSESCMPWAIGQQMWVIFSIDGSKYEGPGILSHSQLLWLGCFFLQWFAHFPDPED